MSKHFYFKSRPGIIWTYVYATGRWVRTRVFRKDVFEPSVDTLKAMNKIGEVNDQ